MLRDPALIPLSRQHQHALALCVRIQRGLAPAGSVREATAAEAAAFEAEAAELFESEVRYHFASEEELLFPAAAQHAELRPLIDELRREHVTLLAQVQAAAERSLGAAALVEFAGLLSAHIRKEERQLFEELQRLMPADELRALGEALDTWFARSGMPGAACALPRRTS